MKREKRNGKIKRPKCSPLEERKFLEEKRWSVLLSLVTSSAFSASVSSFLASAAGAAGAAGAAAVAGAAAAGAAAAFFFCKNSKE